MSLKSKELIYEEIYNLNKELKNFNLNSKEMIAYMVISGVLKGGEGFFSIRELTNFFDTTESNNMQILKNLAEKKAITITRKTNPYSKNLYLHRYIVCNVGKKISKSN